MENGTDYPITDLNVEQKLEEGRLPIGTVVSLNLDQQVDPESVYHERLNTIYRSVLHTKRVVESRNSNLSHIKDLIGSFLEQDDILPSSSTPIQPNIPTHPSIPYGSIGIGLLVVGGLAASYYFGVPRIISQLPAQAAKSLTEDDTLAEFYQKYK